MKEILGMEMSWYTCPEEKSGSPTTYASDVYRLGVLLFEFCEYNMFFIFLEITDLMNIKPFCSCFVLCPPEKRSQEPCLV